MQDKKTLEEKVQLALDIHEIQNIMNKYEILVHVGEWEKVEAMFARDPDVRVEMTWGIYDGTAGVKKLFSGLHNFWMGKAGALKPGLMFALPNANPITEVAGDGKTAKATWLCMGHETMIVDGNPQGFWAFAKRACDYIKEDGEWKMWHYRVYGGFMTPYEQSWVKGFEHHMGEIPEEFKPDRPPSSPLWMYKPDAVFQYEPLVPEPYETFDPKTAF